MEQITPNGIDKHIMLVEDDTMLSGLIRDFLCKHGYRVSTVENGLDAIERIINEQPDLVILDVMLPGISGMEVCKQIRFSYHGMILMQTALDDDIDQMMGLELGADDYVVKQVKPRLLLSRIKALLRRVTDTQNLSVEPSNSKINLSVNQGKLEVNFVHRTVSINNTPVTLSTAEYELLLMLAQRPGVAVNRDDIIRKLKGYEYDGLDRSIDRRISRLRKKLKDDPQAPSLIKTVRGIGYQLCAD